MDSVDIIVITFLWVQAHQARHCTQCRTKRKLKKGKISAQPHKSTRHTSFDSILFNCLCGKSMKMLHV